MERDNDIDDILSNLFNDISKSPVLAVKQRAPQQAFAVRTQTASPVCKADKAEQVHSKSVSTQTCAHALSNTCLSQCANTGLALTHNLQTPPGPSSSYISMASQPSFLVQPMFCSPNSWHVQPISQPKFQPAATLFMNVPNTGAFQMNCVPERH